MNSDNSIIRDLSLAVVATVALFGVVWEVVLPVVSYLILPEMEVERDDTSSVSSSPDSPQSDTDEVETRAAPQREAGVPSLSPRLSRPHQDWDRARDRVDGDPIWRKLPLVYQEKALQFWHRVYQNKRGLTEEEWEIRYQQWKKHLLDPRRRQALLDDRRQRWNRDVDLLFAEIQQSRGWWSHQAMKHLEFRFPNKVKELRARVLDQWPQREWGRPHHINLLRAIHQKGGDLSLKEKKLLIEKGWILPKGSVRARVLADKTGETTLQEIARCSKDSIWALGRWQVRFASRQEDLKSVVHQIPEERKGSPAHVELLRILAQKGYQLSHQEQKWVEENHSHGLPENGESRQKGKE